MTPQPETPGFEDVVADLRMLRLEGLVRLRHVRLAALERAADPAERAEHADPPAASGPKAVEALLRRAVDGLGGGNLGEAASYTFGLAPGTRDWPAQDRRRRAAEVYGVSVERFRKHQERVVFEQVAEQILAAASIPIGPLPTSPQATGPLLTNPSSIPLGTGIPLAYPVGTEAVPAPITVHAVSIDLLTDIDILVSPANVYLEVAKLYSATVAGRLRAAAALRDGSGRVVDDVVQRELRDWLEHHGGQGVAVVPGTVAPTSSGALAAQGVRRLYHAAVAAPRPSTNDYHVDAETVVRTVREVFALARKERADFEPPLGSLCLPLIGSGRGGMSIESSLEALWWSVTQELERDPG